MPARKKKKDLEEMLRELVEHLDQAVTRMEQALDRVDRMLEETVSRIERLSHGLVDDADRKVTGKIGEVETSALKMVAESVKGAGEVVKHGIEGAQATVRRVSHEVQAVIDRAYTVLWTAIGALALLCVFAFILFYVDRAEDRPTYQAEGVMLFTGLIFIAAPILAWVISAGVRTARNARRDAADKQVHGHGPLGFVDYLFGFLYVRERVPNVFGVLALLGVGLTIVVAIILYSRQLL
jgi:hypothetical protein